MMKSLNDKEHKILWTEYEYRHTHIWSTIYKVTGAVAAVSVVPYLKPDIMSELGLVALSLPLIAVGMAVLGLARLTRELELLDKIKTKYREVQKRDLGIEHPSKGRFARDVKLYLWLLVALSIVNGVYMFWH